VTVTKMCRFVKVQQTYHPMLSKKWFLLTVT